MVHEHIHPKDKSHKDRVRNEDLNPAVQRPLVVLAERKYKITTKMMERRNMASSADFMDPELRCPHCRHKHIQVYMHLTSLADNGAELHCAGCYRQELLKHDENGYLILDKEWLASTPRPSDWLIDERRVT